MSIYWRRYIYAGMLFPWIINTHRISCAWNRKPRPTFVASIYWWNDKPLRHRAVRTEFGASIWYARLYLHFFRSFHFDADPWGGGHEQLISNGGRIKPAFTERDKKQKMIDLRGISLHKAIARIRQNDTRSRSSFRLGSGLIWTGQRGGGRGELGGRRGGQVQGRILGDYPYIGGDTVICTDITDEGDFNSHTTHRLTSGRRWGKAP